MPKLIVLFVLVFFALAGQAKAALLPCYGAPSDYKAAFDKVDGTLGNGVRYPEPRVFLEVQSHLIPPGETLRHHFEHLHVGACYPYAETWVQGPTSRTVDFRLVFHNVENYNVRNFAGNFIDANNSGGGFQSTAAQDAELEAAMDASADTTKKVFQSYTMANIGTSCRKTFRASLDTVRANSSALVDEWFAATQWTSTISYAGQPVCTPEFTVDQVRSRSWILPNGGYLYTTARGHRASTLDNPKCGSFNVTLSGSDSVTVTVKAYVDPDFHVHPDNLGIWNQSYQVSGQLPISVPLAGMSQGLHRLVLITDRGMHSSIVVIPFKKGSC